MWLFMKQLKTVSVLVGLFCFLMLSSCGGGGGSSSNAGGSSGGGGGVSSAKEITSYKVNNIPATIDGTARTISFVVPYSTDLSKLDVTFTTTGASVTVGNTTHLTGTVTASHDFTSPVVYRVTALDGTTNDYTARATVASKISKSIISYSFVGFPAAPVTIDEPNGIITVTVPFAADLRHLVAHFTTTGEKVKVGDIDEETDITPNDFTNQVSYLVLPASGEPKEYKVIVNHAPNTAKSIASYWITDFPAAPVTIDEASGSILVTLPSGTKLDTLVANYTTTAGLVKIGNIVQETGKTPNDFTSPVIYTVVPASGEPKEYTVTIKVMSNTAKEIISFGIMNFSSAPVTINETEGTIKVTLPYGTDRKNLIASYTTTGDQVRVGDRVQATDETTNDFSQGPVIYTITAADGSVKDYTVTIEEAADTAKAIVSYEVINFPAAPVTINETEGTILVTLPYNTDRKNLIAIFRTTGNKVKVGVTTQSSGETPNDFTSTDPVIYTVTAADGSVKNYTVTIENGLNTAKSIISYGIKDFPAAPVSIDESKGIISVILPYGTDRKNLTANFSTTGETVKIGEEIQLDGQMSHNFTDPVVYTVIAADKSSKDYKVTVSLTPQSKFIPYYPEGCTLNNDTTGTVGTCTCIQDSTTLDVWMANPSENTLKWVDAGTWASSNNTSSTCGFKEGWSLPTKKQLDYMSGYLVGNSSGDARSKWLNSHGFTNVKPDSYYWGPEAEASMQPPYDLNAYILSMNTGSVVKTFQGLGAHAWAVHSKKPSFIPYYPKGCTLNNDTDGIVGTCTCIQDPTTLDVWLAKPLEDAVWSDAKNWATANNTLSTCGLTKNWDLPSTGQLGRMLTTYMTNLNNGDERSQRLNSIGFTGTKTYSDYWGPEYAELPIPSAYFLSITTGRVEEDATKRYLLNAWAVYTSRQP